MLILYLEYIALKQHTSDVASLICVKMLVSQTYLYIHDASIATLTSSSDYINYCRRSHLDFLER